jgi:hypothetical protein
MNRREFARNVVGALFGVSLIPPALEKPPFPKINVNWTFSKEVMDGLHLRRITPYPQVLRRVPLTIAADISIADKLRIRDTLG